MDNLRVLNLCHVFLSLLLGPQMGKLSNLRTSASQRGAIDTCASNSHLVSIREANQIPCVFGGISASGGREILGFRDGWGKNNRARDAVSGSSLQIDDHLRADSTQAPL